MSKRSPGSKAQQKAGKAQHVKERNRAREKRQKREQSLSEAFTEVINEIGLEEAKEKK